jgi:hypothetical protein
VCQAALAAPGCALLDATRCPRCSAELWVLSFPQGPAFFPRRPGQTVYDLLAALAGPHLGLSAAQFEGLLRKCDALDVVEFLTEVEEAMRGSRVSAPDLPKG